MSMKFDFTGKVALVTGSSSGIGAATAILFAKSGANVVVTGRNGQKVAEVAKQCTAVSPAGLRPLEVVADVTKEDDMQRLVNTTIETYGKLDILVNNAGGGQNSDLDDPEFMSKYKHVLDTNLNSVVYLTYLCAKHLQKTAGNIINVSSIGSFLTIPKSAPYCMFKSALNMFSKCIAVELGPKGIRVNCVNPGCVRTDIIVALGVPKEISDKIWDSYGHQYPVGRAGNPEDIANNILFLAANESSFVTGITLVSDGGHMAANVNFPAFE